MNRMKSGQRLFPWRADRKGIKRALKRDGRGVLKNEMRSGERDVLEEEKEKGRPPSF